jgi:hypothetical protein
MEVGKAIAEKYNNLSDEEYWSGGRYRKQAAQEICDLIRARAEEGE